MPIQYINGIRRNVTPQGVIIPEETSAITAPILEDVKPLELPDLTPEPDYTASISAIPSMESIMASQPTTPTEQNQTDMSSRILKLYEQMGGQPAAQITAEQQAGLPQYQAQLTDINSQIQSLQKEAMAIPLQIQQQAQGRGVTAGGVAPIQTGRLRENAIKALGLSAIGQTLQGNIALAQSTANRAVELEFAPKQAEIDYLTKALDINMAQLNREDQKKAQQQQVLLQERQRLLDNQKEDKNIIMGWAAEAGKNGAPSVVISQALGLSDPSQALSLLSQYFQDPFAKEAAIADLEYKRAQTSGIKSSMELDRLKTEADIAATKASTSLAWAKFQADQEQGTTPRTEIIDNGKGGKMLINLNTGEVIRDYGIDPVTGQTVNPGNELKTNALTSAQELLRKLETREGTIAVGGSRILRPFGSYPGTPGANFENQFNNLKNLISLDNAKYLRGQGSISEGERDLLAKASSNLSLTQSETEFKKNLVAIINNLGGASSDTYTANGKTYKKGADGLYYEQ